MSFLNSIYTLIMKWVFPNHCISCNDNLDEGILCNLCINQLEPTDGRDRLSEIFFQENIDKAFACWWFTDALQEVIHHLKYSDRARVGKVLGKMAAVHLDNSAISSLDILTAIPLHPKKKRERGYNQALWIGKGLSEQARIPFDASIIHRQKYTVSQTTLDREERLQNMENAFVTSRPLNGLKIGIVDDVLTTGATMSACAKKLKQNGAERVVAITLAAPKIQKEKTS